MAKKKGLQVIALTDHDTISGAAEARAEGRRLGVTVLPGIEMSAREYHTFHILGYCFDTKEPGLNAWLHELETGRGERKLRIMAFLREKGIDFPLEEVDELAAGGIVGRPHFCRVILKHGFCKTWEEAFHTYLDTDEFHRRVDNEKPEGKLCVEKIKCAGGIVSLAHPYQIGLEREALEALIRRMKGWGLDAIECFHSGHTQEQISYYLSLAKKYDLLITGGSDFHGERIKADRPMVRLTLELERFRT